MRLAHLHIQRFTARTIDKCVGIIVGCINVNDDPLDYTHNFYLF